MVSPVLYPSAWVPHEVRTRTQTSNWEDLRGRFNEHHRKTVEGCAVGSRTRRRAVYNARQRSHWLGQIRVLTRAAGWSTLCRGLALKIRVHSQLGVYPKKGQPLYSTFPIYDMGAAALGDNVPVVLRQSGPPHATALATATLSASPEAPASSALLPIFGERWSNQHTSVDV